MEESEGATFIGHVVREGDEFARGDSDLAVRFSKQNQEFMKSGFLELIQNIETVIRMDIRRYLNRFVVTLRDL